MKGCKLFREIEDEILQQLDIMGLCLKASRKLEKDIKVKEYLKHGIEAYEKVHTLTQRVRKKYEETCHCNT